MVLGTDLRKRGYRVSLTFGSGSGWVGILGIQELKSSGHPKFSQYRSTGACAQFLPPGMLFATLGVILTHLATEQVTVAVVR